jgi:integrase
MPTVYTDAQLSAFFKACNARHLAFFKTLLFAGLRMSEAKFLEWSDITDNAIQIRSKTRYGFEPKDHEERLIPIPKELVSLFDRMPPRPGTLVFPTKSGRPDKHMLRHCKRVAVRARLDEDQFSLHKFRRTCITKLLRAGMDLRTVMSIAGHSSIESTMRYLRPMEGEELAGKIEQVWTVSEPR